MFSTEGEDDPRDLHTDEELSVRDQTRLLIGEAVDVLQTCSRWPGFAVPGGPSVTGALSTKLAMFLKEEKTIAFLGAPCSRQSPSSQGVTESNLEKITQQIIDSFAVYVQQDPSCIAIQLARDALEEAPYPWVAKVSVDEPRREETHANGRYALDALHNLRKQVVVILRRQRERIDHAVAVLSENEESKDHD